LISDLGTPALRASYRRRVCRRSGLLGPVPARQTNVYAYRTTTLATMVPEPEAQPAAGTELPAAPPALAARPAVLVPVFERLPAADRFRAAQVCRAWRSAAAVPASWTGLDVRGTAQPAAWLARYGERCVPPRRWLALNAEFCTLADDDLAALPASLRTLNLNGSREIGDKGADLVSASCPDLECVELYWNSRITSVGIGHIARRCQRLRHLSLSGCKGATDDGLLALASEGGGELTFLDLTRCPGLTDASIAAAVRANPGLTSVNLYATPAVTDRVCIAMGESLRGLQFLDLCGASSITDASIAALGEGCGASLTLLSLTWATQLTDASLATLATFSQLGFLSLFGILKLTDAGLAQLSEGCAHSLRTLDVNGCCNISCFRDRTALQRLFPKVHTWVVHS
jgi:F-box/leucine-rich repeat protein 2/20